MNLLIVEDQAILRELLAETCQRAFTFELVCPVGSVSLARAELLRVEFALVLLDLCLPDGDGIEAADWISRLPHPPPILGISGYIDEVSVYRVMHSKMNGFLDKTALSIICLRHAIEDVLAGRVHFSASVREIYNRLKSDPDGFPKLLTDHECTLLAAIANGESDQRTAADLGISIATVRWHRKQIMGKLEIHNSSQLSHYALKRGLRHWSRTSPN